jgi:hypothetical protein
MSMPPCGIIPVEALSKTDELTPLKDMAVVEGSHLKFIVQVRSNVPSKTTPCRYARIEADFSGTSTQVAQ